MLRLFRAHQGRHQRSSKARAVVVGISVVSIAAAIAIAAQIGYFYFHSSTGGRALIGRERRAIAAAGQDAKACQQPAAATSAAAGGRTPTGLLEAPLLGLVAPVLQGTGDAVLSDAVGHLQGTVWPGQPGTSVLAGHDVTWFSHITQLQPGDQIQYVTPCRTYTYKVTSHAIVSAGTEVDSTGAPRLILDTCWPLDALYLTSTRYLVYANLVGSAPTHPATAAPASWPEPAVPAPPALAAQGLSLAQNDAPLGTLGLAGSPSGAWIQSSAPLQFQDAALAAYFGLARSAAQGEGTWWADLAPSVPVSAAGALWGGQISHYDSSLRITLRVNGTRPAGATLAATVTVTGPAGTGTYDLTVSETVSGGKLLVTGVQAKPAG